jgi:hypothetical protein
LRAFSPKIEQSELQFDNLPRSNIKVKVIWSYTCTVSYIFVVWRLIKLRTTVSCLHRVTMFHLRRQREMCLK